MTSLIARGALTVVLGALVTGGCGDSGGTAPSSGTPASVERSFSTLETREGAHHRLALETTERLVLKAETRRYAVDMDSLMDAMMDSCLALGGGGVMRDHDMGRMGNMAGWMDDVIDGHRARMDSLFTLEDMRAECDEHHEEMLDLLDEMHDALPGRGMMGGGMMGGGRM